MYSLPSFVHIRKAAFLALTAILLTFAIRPLFAASIMLPDGSTYSVELVAHGGGSYTYQVSEVSGKDLSHWLLEFGLCAEHLVSAEPAGYEVGLDASTGYTGIKWNVTDEFTSGLFTIHLDAEYPIGQVQALVKAGSQHATGYVDGPVCSVQPPPQDPEPPTATPTPQDDPTPDADPTATETPGNTIPPVPTNTPGDPTATQTTQPPDDPAPTATLPSATETPVLPTATPPDGCEWIGDLLICDPTPTGTTQPADPTPTQRPPVTVTIVPPTATPPPTLIPPVTVTPPTPTPTVPPTNEDDGPEPTFWYYWLPLVSDCRYGDAEFQGCGR